jgi:hypothetical protein
MLSSIKSPLQEVKLSYDLLSLNSDSGGLLHWINIDALLAQPHFALQQVCIVFCDTQSDWEAYASAARLQMPCCRDREILRISKRTQLWDLH